MTRTRYKLCYKLSDAGSSIRTAYVNQGEICVQDFLTNNFPCFKAIARESDLDSKPRRWGRKRDVDVVIAQQVNTYLPG